MPIRITRSIVPNLFTLANLYCGFSAIIMFSHHDYVTGAFYIFFAGVFDSLDGYMARITKSASELGVELDSLCDAVSFGVAPSFMLYQIHYAQYPEYGMLVASLPAMAGVYRLARFNTQLTSLEDKSYFSGMPIPSGALTIVTFAVYFLVSGNIPNEYLHTVVNFVTVVTSLAMISTIKYDNLPRPSKRSLQDRPFVFIAFVLGVLAIIITKGWFAFPFMMLYMTFGALRHWITLMKRKSEDEPIDEELDDDDDDD